MEDIFLQPFHKQEIKETSLIISLKALSETELLISSGKSFPSRPALWKFYRLLVFCLCLKTLFMILEDRSFNHL